MLHLRTGSSLVLTTLTVLMISLLGACDEQPQSQSVGDSPRSDAILSSGATDDVNPLGKYNPAIDLTVARSAASLTFNEGVSIDKNPYYDAYARDLGIIVKNKWVAPTQDSYNNKLNVSISSGNIPDLFIASPIQFRNLVDAGMVEDLTDAYRKYASDDLKKLMAEDSGSALDASTVGGKLFAIPQTVPAIGSASMLWLREDWLDRVHLQPPKTMDDVVAIARAFANGDPDRNGKNDTYGMALSQELMLSGAPGLEGFFQGFHAFPGSWIKDRSGTVLYGSIQPEMKPALITLAQMYKEGLIDKEFGAKDISKAHESINAGKVGLFFGDFSASFYANKDSVVRDPDAKWKAYPIPSVDGTPVKTLLGSTASSFYVVKKGYPHPEAVVKLANYWVDRSFVHEDHALGTDETTGIPIYVYSIVSPIPALIQFNQHIHLKKALASGDASNLSFDEKAYFDNINTYKANPNSTKDPKVHTGWMIDRTFGVGNSGLEIVDYYLNNSLYLNSALTVAITPTIIEKMATLHTMENDMLTRIIMGDAGIEEFDIFVEDWYEQGGKEILEEVNTLH